MNNVTNYYYQCLEDKNIFDGNAFMYKKSLLLKKIHETVISKIRDIKTGDSDLVPVLVYYYSFFSHYLSQKNNENETILKVKELIDRLEVIITTTSKLEPNDQQLDRVTIIKLLETIQKEYTSLK